MSDKRDEVIKKLDTIIALLAVQGKERNEQVKILTSLGLSSKEVEDITGIPAPTVRGLRSTGNKKGVKASKK